VVLYGSLGDEERLCDLPVRLAAGRQLRDAQFTGRQRVASPDGITAGPASGGHELLASPVSESETAQCAGQVQALAEEFARPAAGTGPAVRRAQVK